MSWHPFKDGSLYTVDEVVEICEEYIHAGKPINPLEKRRHVSLIRNCGEREIVYSPKGLAWGRSPMNERCWLTVTGKPICDKTTVARNI